MIDPPVDVAVLSAAGQTEALEQLDGSSAPAGLTPSELDQVLAQAPIFVRPGTSILEGRAVDPSGVSSVEVEVLDPYGDTANKTCQVAAPMSGVWSCMVDLSGAQNEARYFARARATNSVGYTSEWSLWRVLLINSLPPTVSLDEESQSALSAVIGPAAMTLRGEIQDSGQVKNVDVCLDTTGQPGMVMCQTVELSENHVLNGAWSTKLSIPLGLDYASQTISIFGRDAAGNRSTAPYEKTFWIDTKSPNVTVTTQLPSVSLAAYSIDPFPILAGAASDGSGKVEIALRMTSPEAGTRRTVIPIVNNQWSFIPEIEAAGRYRLSLEARDTAGNLTSLGFWTLQVTEQYNIWMPQLIN